MSGAVTDRFGVGPAFDALTFVAGDLEYGPNLFYYLRHDPSANNFSTFGTISTSGAVTDRFGVGLDFDALTFVAGDLVYGANLFYYLRHDPGANNFSTLGTISTSGAVTDRFGVGLNFDALTFVAGDLEYGPNLFYYLRHDPSANNFSTFGTISTSGAVTDRFGVGLDFDALTFVAGDLVYGANLFYYLRHDPGANNFSTLGTISTSGAVTDRFGVGLNFDALTFVAGDLEYGPNLFYYLRHDPSANNFSTFGTISTSGAVTDRFGVGLDFDALTFVAGDLVYGANLFYYLRHDPGANNFSTLGTISTSGAVTDRFGVGLNFDALTFVAGDLEYGPNLFYYLRHDPSANNFSTFGTISTSGAVTDRFGVGLDFDALTFVAGDLVYGANLFYYLRHDPGANNFSTLGTISTSGAVTDRFGVGLNFDALTFVAGDLEYGPNLFYYLRHDPSANNFSTFGTISTSGAVTDRFGVGLDFDALTFVAGDLVYGANLFYYLRHDPGANNFSTLGTISTSGAVTDRFGVGLNFDALTFVAGDLEYGPNLFYYLRHDPSANNFSTFGTISTSGAVTDRFGVGLDFDALTFVAGDLVYGANLFYYLRHDPGANNFSTLGTISTSGAVTDRFGVGLNFDALTFVAGDLGYGPNLFYYLRQDPSANNFSTLATISTSGAVTDRFGVGLDFDALTFVAGDLGYGPNLFYYLRHDPSANNFSTLGTISTSGAVTDRFGVGLNFDALTFVAGDLGYGPNLFYYLRQDP